MKIRVIPTSLPDVKMIEPSVFTDERGFFYESFNAQEFAEAIGEPVEFVQDNHSASRRHVLRGLHYQVERPQGKLVRAVVGEIFDVAVDIRHGSPTFGQWTGMYLSAENRRQAWVPAGFAHGFVVTSERAEVLYKTTDFWFPEYERCLVWNDADVGIEWPIETVPVLASRDAAGLSLKALQSFFQR